MKEFSKKILIFGVWLIMSITATLARDIVYNGINYTVYDNNSTAETKSGIYSQNITGNEVSGDIVIPEIVYDGDTPYTVVSIGAASFLGCTEITSVLLPSSIKTIGRSSFKNCTNLTEINIPDGVEKIYNEVFQGCIKLQSIDIPENITVLNEYVFSNCTSLKSVRLPNSLQVIGRSCFSGCSSLAEINFPEGLITISTESFSGCSNIETINLPNSIKTIGDYAFSGCKCLKAIILPQSLTSIGPRWFSGCISLESIELPQSVTSINYNAFYGCSSLASIVLPQSLTSIGEQAFSFCRKLTSIEFPKTLISIGSEAFSECSAIKHLSLPNSLTSISSQTFRGCENLESIELPQSLTSIGYNAFSGCSNLISIKFPQSLTTIGSYAFNSCQNLTSIELPQSLSSIGEQAFSGTRIQQVICKSKNIAVKDAFPKLKKCAYPEGCENPFSSYDYAVCFPLDKTVIEDGFIYSQDKSQLYFAPIYAEDNYILPDDVRYIGPAAFANCSSINNITLSANLEKIEAQAFAGCYLSSIKSGNPTPPIVNNENVFEQRVYANAKLMISDGSFNKYRNADVWKKFIKIASSDGDNIYVHDISLNINEINTAVGQTFKLSVTVSPLEATDKQLSWQSSNEKVAVVDNNGIVKVTGRGEATVTVSTLDGSNLSASCVIKAVQPVTDIRISQSEIILKAGEFRIIDTTIEPADANDRSVTWNSTDPSVARVENGVVFAISDGEADIEVLANDGFGAHASCHVIVRTLITSIQLSTNELSLKKGEFTTLTATVLPDNASINALEWSSSNETVATVSNGLVLAYAQGKAVIRVSATDGSGIYAECNVTVEDPAGVEDVLADPSTGDAEYYDVHGIKLPHSTPGINIVRYKDGTVKRVYNR